MKKIIILGAGGQARVVADILLQRKKKLNEKIEIIGFLDNNFQKKPYNNIYGYKILGDFSLIEKFKNYDYIIAIGDNLTRKKIAKKYYYLNYCKAIHYSAIIGEKVNIQKGSVIMANVVLNSFASIGEHSIINTASVIEHECRVGNFVHISPGAILCGAVNIEELVWIGARTVVIQNKYIGEGSIIGAGSVVTKNIEKNSLSFGNPAKIKGGK